nr:MAG TPA: hypothetical protein [Caudoviricetes sp.]
MAALPDSNRIKQRINHRGHSSWRPADNLALRIIY